MIKLQKNMEIIIRYQKHKQIKKEIS
jgi:hypothetical protein